MFVTLIVTCLYIVRFSVVLKYGGFLGSLGLLLCIPPPESTLRLRPIQASALPCRTTPATKAWS